jgi:hypothetical protein
MAVLKSILLASHSPMPYGCYAWTENDKFKLFWFWEDGFIEQLTIIKK